MTSNILFFHLYWKATVWETKGAAQDRNKYIFIILTLASVELPRELTTSAQEIRSFVNGLKTADTDYLRKLRNKTNVF